MSRQLTMTLAGVLAGQPTLFNGLTAPAGVDKQQLIGRIMRRANNLEVLYPDGPYFEWAIGNWSLCRQDVWERLEQTRHYDYNPIHNYDRHETETSTRDGKYKDDRTLDHTHTTDTTGNEVYAGEMDSTFADDSTTTTTVAGFNNPLSTTADNKVVVDDDQTRHQTESSNADRTGKESNTANDSEVINRKEDWQDDRGLYAYGNIGVTTTQALIEEQRQVELYNLYDVIAEEFVMEFCLLVY